MTYDIYIYMIYIYINMTYDIYMIYIYYIYILYYIYIIILCDIPLLRLFCAGLSPHLQGMVSLMCRKVCQENLLAASAD